MAEFTLKEAIRNKILTLAETDYKKFQNALIPGEDRLLGVRLPKLRELAKEISKGDWRGYLDHTLSDCDEYFEETMLQGMVIGYAKADLQEILKYTEQFAPKIRNWAICDSFCTGLKIAKKYPERVWEFLLPYLKSDQEFKIRFAVIMMMSHFINDSYIDEILIKLDQVSHNGYYVKMGVAWAISVCFVKYPEKTLTYLNGNHLDLFTYNKSLQKIIESNRVDKETKDFIRKLKRPLK